MNDCSTDRTAALVSSYSDSRIVFLTNKVNSGPSFSRNVGLQISKGDFLAFLDSDDYWLPSHLLNVWEYSRNNLKVQFFYTGVIVQNGANFFKRYGVPEVDIHSLLMRTPISTCSVVIRRKATEGLGFRDVFYDDLLFWYEVLVRCGKAVRVDPRTAVYVLTEGSYSSNKLISAKEVYNMYKKNLLLSLPKRMYYFLGYIYFGIVKVIMQQTIKTQLK